MYVTPKDALADIAYADWHGKFTPLGIKVILYPIMMSVCMYFRKDFILLGELFGFLLREIVLNKNNRVIKKSEYFHYIRRMPSPHLFKLLLSPITFDDKHLVVRDYTQV